jgi:5-methylcytosine-specific restriction enzyme subunit McrC
MRSVRFLAFEHQQLVVGARCALVRGGETEFTMEHFETLAKYIERSGTPAMRVGHKRIKLGHHVGYLRVGNVSLEVYPKLREGMPEGAWRDLLLEMIRVVEGVRLAPQDHAHLHQRPGDLYELLVTRFLQLVDGLLRGGLARAYRQVEANETVIRGRLCVSDHVRENAARPDRVFVAYDVYDADNLPNRILHRALGRVRRNASSPDQIHTAGAAMAAFPDVDTRPIAPGEWAAWRPDRRTARYVEAITLARMILLDERPDLRWGDREMVAILFDMNHLFEGYLAQAMRGIPGVRVHTGKQKHFWSPPSGRGKVLKPDVLAYLQGKDEPVVVDAKWKRPKDDRPDDADLRQVYAYLHAFSGARGMLLYPRADPGQTAVTGGYLKGPMSAGTAFMELFDSEGKPSLKAVQRQMAGVLGVSAPPA